MRLARVHRVTKGGKLYRYHAVTRKALPRDVPEDHPTFLAAWAAEEARAALPGLTAPAGSIGAAWTAYAASKPFLALSAPYRRVMQRHGQAIRETYASVPMNGLRPEHIEADLAKLDPIAARARVKAWRGMCAYAKAHGLARIDASKAVTPPKAPPTAGHLPWTADEIDAFRRAHAAGSPARAGFELLLWTAARTIDAVTLGRAHVGRDGLLTFRQSKTGGEAIVPWTSTLPAWAEGWEEERAMVREAVTGPGFTFLETADGRPRSHKGLSNLISAAARKAGIYGKSAHGLRKTRLTLIAEAGGSTQAIMAWGGHRSLSEAERYTREADRKRAVMGANGERTSETVLVSALNSAGRA